MKGYFDIDAAIMKNNDTYHVKLVSNHTDEHESSEILAKNIVALLQMEVHGKVYAHYNRFTDILEVFITNRVLNVEPFRYHYANLSRDMHNGISSEVISRFVVKEYHDYVDLYVFKKY